MEQANPPTIDAIQLAVLTKRFEGIAAKMEHTLLRTARSGIINNGADFSCAILTGDARLVNPGTAIPIHVMSGPDMMAQSMIDLHPDLCRGDAYLHNSPYHGCSHAADQSILVPVIDEAGVHRFTVLAKAHQADIGNSLPTTYMTTARDVFHEGALIFPAVKVQSDYHDIADVIRMCTMRIRVPEQWHGDYLAALGAARIGERELLALGDEVGWPTLEAYVERWFDYSEARMAAALARLPSGRMSARSVHDPFPGTPPEGIPIQVTVTVDAEAERIEVDLRDNPDCLPCGLNLSEACARTAAMIGVFDAIATEVPPNAGSFRMIVVHLREGCVAGIPVHPTSCSLATTNVADRVTNAIHRAIAEHAQGFGMAEGGAVATAANAVISGRDPRAAGAPFVNHLVLADTCGQASPSEDGWLVMGSAGGAGQGFCDSIEVDESLYPIRIAVRGLVADSEGAGRFRGAPSSIVEYGPVDCDLTVLIGSDGEINPPLGARGGLPGAASRHYTRDASGALTERARCGEVVLAPGETVIGISCAGGGYGLPAERDPARVKHDVDEGYLTRTRAEEVYRVVLDDSGEVDTGATVALRAKHRRAEPPEEKGA